MADDPRCIKCGKLRSDHNFFGEWGYLCHNGSNTFLAVNEVVDVTDDADVQALKAELEALKAKIARQP